MEMGIEIGGGGYMEIYNERWIARDREKTERVKEVWNNDLIISVLCTKQFGMNILQQKVIKAKLTSELYGHLTAPLDTNTRIDETNPGELLTHKYFHG